MVADFDVASRLAGGLEFELMRAVHQVEDSVEAPSSTADIETSLCQSQLRVSWVNRILQMHFC